MGWWGRRQEARRERYRQQLAALLKRYPDDNPIIVEGLLAGGPVERAAGLALANAAAQLAQDTRLRRMIRDEIHAALKREQTHGRHD